MELEKCPALHARQQFLVVQETVSPAQQRVVNNKRGPGGLRMPAPRPEMFAHKHQQGSQTPEFLQPGKVPANRQIQIRDFPGPGEGGLRSAQVQFDEAGVFVAVKE